MRPDKNDHMLLELIALIGHAIMSVLGVFSFVFNWVHRKWIYVAIVGLFLTFNIASAYNHLRDLLTEDAAQ